MSHSLCHLSCVSCCHLSSADWCVWLWVSLCGCSLNRRSSSADRWRLTSCRVMTIVHIFNNELIMIYKMMHVIMGGISARVCDQSICVVLSGYEIDGLPGSVWVDKCALSHRLSTFLVFVWSLNLFHFTVFFFKKKILLGGGFRFLFLRLSAWESCKKSPTHCHRQCETYQEKEKEKEGMRG